jgi:hypothetical protein
MGENTSGGIPGGEIGAGRLQFACMARANNDLGTFADEIFGDGFAQAETAAGNQRMYAFEFHQLMRARVKHGASKKTMKSDGPSTRVSPHS